MCGISGYYCFGKNRPTKEELNNLFVGIMDRGKDASGVAFFDDHEHLVVNKDNKPANVYIKGEFWQSLETMPKMMIMHCRAATSGSPTDNKNNHPIFSKHGMALIHNGIIRNDKQLIAKHGFKTDGLCDSEVILKLIEKGWWEDRKNLDELDGGYSCAAIWQQKPDELMLFRNSNPMALYISKDRDILFFASTTEILKNSLARYHRGFKVGSIVAYELADEKAVLVNAEGVADIHKISPTRQPWQNNQFVHQGRGGYYGFDADEYMEDWRRKSYVGFNPNEKRDAEKKEETKPCSNLLSFLQQAKKNKKQKHKGNNHWRCDCCNSYTSTYSFSHKHGRLCPDCLFVLGAYGRLKCPTCGGILSVTATDGKCTKCNTILKAVTP